MQPVNTRPLVQSVSAMADKPVHSIDPVSNLESQLQASSVSGRRDMIAKFAAAFALAAGSANNRAEAVAPPVDGERLEKVFGKEYKEEELQKAEDFTAYNKVQTKAGYAPKPAKETSEPGSVEIQPLVAPGVVLLSALVVGGVPALLSPGQTAFEAQRTASGKPSKLGATRGKGKGKASPPSAKKKFFR